MSVTPTRPSHPKLSIDRSAWSDGTPTLICRGRLTQETATLLKSEVKSLSPQNKHVMADMSEVTFVDSAGLGGLLGIYVSAKSDGCYFELVNVHPHLRDLLNMTHLTAIFAGK
jgi:anti-sigma B factor antagonist